MRVPPPSRVVNALFRCAGFVRRLCCLALGALIFIGLPAGAQATRAPIQIAAGVYLLPGQRGEVTPANAGRVANAAFVVGPAGVVVVDTGASALEGEEIIAAVGRVTHRRIRLAIVTHPSQEVLFGAAAFQAHGIPVMLHRNSAALMAARCDGCLKNLTQMLGDDVMRGTRVITPDRVIEGTQSLDVIGRPLLLIAPAQGSAPGALAVFDPQTRTLLAGSLGLVDSVPDMRDADGAPWRSALTLLAATRCSRLVPAYGGLGTCADLARLDDYFTALEARIGELLAAHVGLADVGERSELPRFASWNRYEPLHRQNAHRVYLRMERGAFGE